MGFPIHQVDAFASEVFRGNPAAVCLLSGPVEPGWMQRVAGEMNLSETAFVVPQGQRFGLRWFTPAVEVDLCGHATLASAHVLWSSGQVPADQPVAFETKSGTLVATHESGWITLDFPAEPASSCDAPEGLIESLGGTVRVVAKNRMDYLVELENDDQVRSLQPDLTRLKTLPVRGVIVTAADTRGEHDFISRFFGPGSGVDEDPVTGSAHCCLAPYWREKLGKDKLRGYQASSRGGEVLVHCRGERVLLQGQARTVFVGELSEEATRGS